MLLTLESLLSGGKGTHASKKVPKDLHLFHEISKFLTKSTVCIVSLSTVNANIRGLHIAIDCSKSSDHVRSN